MPTRRPHRGIPPPPAPIRSLLGLAYRAWSSALRRWTRWRFAWLLVLAACFVAAAGREDAWRQAGAAWVIAGSVVWVAGRLAEADAERRCLEHDRSGLPAVGGWRLAGVRGLDPGELLLLALTVHLHENARLVRRPVRGHRHGAWRVTYSVPLRQLAREWAKSAGHVSVRRADGMVRELEARGVVERVTVNQATAYRLTYQRAEDALRHLERSAGRPLVSWALGRDPRAAGWTAGASGAEADPEA